MMIRELRKHWPARKLEWIMGFFLLSWGYYTLTHPEIFSHPATAVTTAYMRQMVDFISPYPALVWGGAATTVALLRLMALLVNGSWTRTPLLRLLSAGLSVFIIAQIWIGLSRSGVSNWGMVVYPCLVLADTLSGYRIAVDMIHAEAQRVLDKGERSSARADARLAS